MRPMDRRVPIDDDPGAVERRNTVWTALLHGEVVGTPIPGSLSDAITAMEQGSAAGYFVLESSGNADFGSLRRKIEETRLAWRNGTAWGNQNVVEAPGKLQRMGLTAANGFAARGAAQTDAFAEELALTIFSYTVDEPKLYFSVNRMLLEHANDVNDAFPEGMRCILPYVKLLTSALEALPKEFIFKPETPNEGDQQRRGRCWRGIRHLFPGYPGYVNAQGTPVSRHDPEQHFPIGRVVSWNAFTSTTEVEQVTLDFVGEHGPATIFDIEVQRGYRIRALSHYGEAEAEVLFPLFSIFEVVSSHRNCTPQGLLPDVAQYPATHGEDESGRPLYDRAFGPDRVQLRQVLEFDPDVEVNSVRSLNRRLRRRRTRNLRPTHDRRHTLAYRRRQAFLRFSMTSKTSWRRCLMAGSHRASWSLVTSRMASRRRWSASASCRSFRRPQACARRCPSRSAFAARPSPSPRCSRFGTWPPAHRRGLASRASSRSTTVTWTSARR